MFKSIACLLFFVCVQLVVSDEITIYSPPPNGIYHTEAIMDIRYRVHRMGMTMIWATSATLTHIESNTTINNFPLVQWSANNNTNETSTHQVWVIPANISNGNYSLAISGNASYLCSENGNGTGK